MQNFELVSRLSLAERLALMEELVASICGQEQDFESPPWHEDVLREREKDLSYRSNWLDFQEVKARLRL